MGAFSRWLIIVTAGLFLLGASLFPGHAALSTELAQNLTVEDGKNNRPFEDQYWNKAELEAQRRIALATEKLTELTQTQIWVSIATAVFLVLTLAATAFTSCAAMKSVKISHRTLVVSQRPWVSVKLKIASSLIFKDGEGRIEIHCLLRNFGPSPANNVEVLQEIVPMQHKAWDEIVRITENARKRHPRKMLGHKIFPNEEFTYRTNIPISRKKIEEIATELGFPDLEGVVYPVIVGCVIYNSTLNDDNHTTEFMVTLGQRDPTNPKIMLGFKTDDGEIPQDQLVLTHGFGSGQAN